MGRFDKLKKQNEVAIANVKEDVNKLYAVAEESKRVSNIAHNAGEIITDLDKQFAKATGLDGKDVAFLFIATGLQIARWIVINQITQVDNAGSDNALEEQLHDMQDKILKNFDKKDSYEDGLYYASLHHIVSTHGVPYDATAYLTLDAVQRLIPKGVQWNFELEDLFTNKLPLFKGANHRFSTLGHDPVLGLVFGTANIMTNTITCSRKVGGISSVGVPIITTNHVVYTTNYKEPQIATYASTGKMLSEVISRVIEEPQALAASLIKQIIHIGTDLYTPCGIQIPGVNLILSNSNIELMTKYISTGDVVKAGSSAMVANLINMIIELVHGLLYVPNENVSRDQYAVKTKKIIMYSNLISTSSNVIGVGAIAIATKDLDVLRNLDIGGLIVTIHRLISDHNFIQKVKQEFLEKEWYNLVMGEDYNF